VERALSYLEHLSRYLLAFGIPGLFALAVLDSAAVPLVGGPDGFVILLAWQRPAEFLLFALAAAVGSTLGCLVLYRIARTCGEMALTRVSPEKRAWLKRNIESNANWAVFLGVIVPPPFPTKPIILAAGAFRTPLTSFAIAVFIGRLVRYTAMAYLGARFGEQTAQVIRSHYPAVLLVLAVVGLLTFLVRRRRRETHVGLNP
jgi:membrane protein YqaA with SNARE-associated domain